MIEMIIAILIIVSLFVKITILEKQLATIKKYIDDCVFQQMEDEMESNSIIFERLYNLESEKNKAVEFSNN